MSVGKLSSIKSQIKLRAHNLMTRTISCRKLCGDICKCNIPSSWRANIEPEFRLKPEIFLGKVLDTFNIEGSQRSADEVVFAIDDLLLEGNFSAVDDILEAAFDMREKIPSNILVNFLSATYPARGKLLKREELYRVTEDVFYDEKADELSMNFLKKLRE